MTDVLGLEREHATSLALTDRRCRRTLRSVMKQPGAIAVVRGRRACALSNMPTRLVVCADGSNADRAVIDAVARVAAPLDLHVSVVCAFSRATAGLDHANAMLRAGCAARLARTLTNAGVRADWDALGGRDPVASLRAFLKNDPGSLIFINASAWESDSFRGLGPRVLRLVETAPAPVVVVGVPPTPRVRIRGSHPARAGGGRNVGGRLAAVALALLFTATWAVATHVESHNYTLHPGAAIAVDPHFVGGASHVDPATGRVLMTTIELRRTTFGEALTSMFGADVEMVNESKVSRGGAPGVSSMTAAKETALALALKRMGRHDLASTSRVSIDTNTIGGGSAGLAFALTIIDMLGPGDLTGGHLVAATGTINGDGIVGPITGIASKTAVARRAGAEVFLVPGEQQYEARAHAGTMAVFGVHTIDDALAVLRSIGGAPHPGGRS